MTVDEVLRFTLVDRAFDVLFTSGDSKTLRRFRPHGNTSVTAQDVTGPYEVLLDVGSIVGIAREVQADD